MITLQQMLVMNNGVLQRVLVPVRGDSASNVQQPTNAVLQNSQRDNSSTNSAQNVQPTMGYHNHGVSHGHMNVNLANMACSDSNMLNQKNFTQLQPSTAIGGASCPVCSMLFPLTIMPDNLREHISRCQEREIAYASHKAMMHAKKRSFSSTDWSHDTGGGERNVSVNQANAINGGHNVPQQTSGLDLLLGAVNKAAKLKRNSFPGEIKSKSSYCQSCNELTPADRRFCHSCGTRKKMSSCFRGVCANRGKWQVQINANGKRHYLGYFPSEIAAAQAYDSAALYFHGDRAKLNFDAESARTSKKPDFLIQIIHQDKMKSKIGTLTLPAENPVSDIETNSDVSTSTTASCDASRNIQYLDLATSALVEASILAAELDGRIESKDPQSTATSVIVVENSNEITMPSSSNTTLMSAVATTPGVPVNDASIEF